MSLDPSQDPRLAPAAVSDESLLSSHEKPLGRQPDDQAHYRLLPLGILFFLSGLILFSATYLNRYAGHFDPLVYNETVNPSSGVVAAAKVDPVVLGKKLFNSPGACVTCHQPDGKGLAGTYPPLAGSEWAQGPEARVISIVLDGLHGQVKVEGTTFNAAAMPSFGATGYNWSDEKISAVLTYVRQEWGNKAPAITPAQVAETRAKLGTHDVWTQDELLQVH